MKKQEAPISFDHGEYEAVLKQYVDEEGKVDYAGLKSSNALEPYLADLARTDPLAMPKAERLAFMINAYNAYTLKLILDNYPIPSIKHITPIRLKGRSLYIPKLNSPFAYKIANVGGKALSLGYIEHQSIRKAFAEPRIHFALVCAAKGCPRLRREAYTGARLSEQLDDQAYIFLRNPEKNLIPCDPGTVLLSPIFSWFRYDFGRNKRERLAFIARYFDGPVREKLEAGHYHIAYHDYDWSLNDAG